MKKPVVMTLALLLCSFFFTFSAGAVDAPHYDPTAGNVCGTCHTVQQTLGSTGYNNICQNCHRPGNPAAGGKSIVPADAANPFGIHSSTGITKPYQTSHRWDGSDTNPAAGAQPPIQGQMTTGGLRARTGGQLACVRCHNQHSNANGNFLRIPNDQDQLCLDCHRSRDVQSHTQGSHPVGIKYADKVAAKPTLFNNANPANPSSNLFARMSSAGGTLLCSTCHSVHFADSRSSTADSSANFANLSSGDGYLLRTDRRGENASAVNICTNCHAGKFSHNGASQNVQCVDCHGAHVEYDQLDPMGKANIFLVRRSVPSGTSGSGRVYFNYSGGNLSYKRADTFGVCQGCHTVPEPGGVYPPEHSSSDKTVCNKCHFHWNPKGSFSGACLECHGYPPTNSSEMVSPATGATQANAGAHDTHANGRKMACNTCHNGYTYDNKSIDIGFAISSSNFKGFVGPSIIGGTFNGTTPINGYKWNRGPNTNGTNGNTEISCNVYCHGATLASGTGNKPVWTGTNQAACGSCHATTGISTGSHTNHLVGNPDCGKCHTGATPTSYPYTGTSHSHINGQVDVANGFTSATKSCSSANCHANPYGAGSLTSPVWGTSVGCAACHNGSGAFSSYSAPATGSHTKHRAKSTACNQCHAGTIAGSYGGDNHVDGDIDVINGYPTNVAKHDSGTYTGTCSTASCHANVYGTGTVTTPVWGTNAGCAACHINGNNGVGAFNSYSSPTTGSHVKHIAGTGVQCNKCHTGALKGVDGGSAHVNGVVNVDAALGYYSSSISKHAANTYAANAKCSTASCHSDPYSTAQAISPVWGTTSGCESCHNAGGAFTGTGNGPATGSHNKHMAATALSVKCGDCHSGAVANTTGGSAHANGFVNVTQGYYSSSVSKHAAGTYSANAKCSTTCHSPYTTPVTTPAWGTTSDCSSCHSLPPATGSHGISAHSGQCSACHDGATIGGFGIVPDAGPNHFNGKIDVLNGYPVNKTKGSTAATCTTASCHPNVYGTGYAETPTWGTTGNGCTACHTTPIGVNGPATGSHATVAGHAVACTTCHAAGTTATSTPATGHLNGFIDVANVGYATLNKTKGTAGTTCSTASCHASPVSTALIVTPAWGSTGNGCVACHTGANTITATGPATGSHTTVAGHAVACTTCHAAGTSATTVPSVGHADGDIDVANVGYATLNKTKGTAGTTCSTASCHASPVSTALIVTPAWGSTGNGCVACHTGANAITATGPATGSHTTVAGHAVACTTCHAAGTSATSAPSTGHANGYIDVANVGYASLNKTKGTAGVTCATASCHVSPAGTALIVTPAWGSTGNGCAACHTGANAITATGPATGSHTTIAGHAVACTTCHAAGTSATSAPSTGHANGYIDVANVGYASLNKTKGTAGTTCSATVCHGSTSPAWGANTANALCTKCHGTPSTSATNANMAPAIGAHQAHVHGTGSNSYSRELSCTECHNSGTSVSFTNHMNGNTQNVVFTNASTAAANSVVAAYTAGTYPNGTCTTYCHGASLKNGDTSGTNRTPSWTANMMTGTKLTDCAMCHGNPPTSVSGSHLGQTPTTSCTTCHNHFDATGGFTTEANRRLHIDGIVQSSGSGCNGCHDFDTNGATNTSGKWSGGTWGKTNYGGYPSVSEGWGAHATHINFIKSRLAIGTPLVTSGTFGSGEAANVCGTCHTNTPANHTMGATGTTLNQGRMINFGDSNFKIGTAGASLLFGSTNPVYNGASGTTGGTTNKTCSNLSCHYFTTPLWSSY